MSIEKEEKYYVLGFILGSIYRRKVLVCLNNAPTSPKNISKLVGIRINHVSNILKQLCENKLVKCETPNLKKGRVYSVTNKGKESIRLLDKIT